MPYNDWFPIGGLFGVLVRTGLVIILIIYAFIDMEQRYILMIIALVGGALALKDYSLWRKKRMDMKYGSTIDDSSSR